MQALIFLFPIVFPSANFFDLFEHGIETVNCRLEFERTHGIISKPRHKKIHALFHSIISSDTSSKSPANLDVMFDKVYDDHFREGYWEARDGVEHFVSRPKKKTLEKMTADIKRQVIEKGYFVTNYRPEEECILANDIAVHALGAPRNATPVVTARSKYSVEPGFSQGPFDFDIGRFPFGIPGIGRNAVKVESVSAKLNSAFSSVSLTAIDQNGQKHRTQIIYHIAEEGSPVYLRNVRDSAGREECVVFEWYRLEGSKAPRTNWIIPTHTLQCTYVADPSTVTELRPNQFLESSKTLINAIQFLATSCSFDKVVEIAFAEPVKELSAGGTPIRLPSKAKANYSTLKSVSERAIKNPRRTSNTSPTSSTFGDFKHMRKRVPPEANSQESLFQSKVTIGLAVAIAVCVSAIVWRYRHARQSC